MEMESYWEVVSSIPRKQADKVKFESSKTNAPKRLYGDVLIVSKVTHLTNVD